MSALDALSGGKPAGPRPLKVVAPKLTCDIDDFADEVHARYALGFHGLRRQFIGVDAAARDFRFCKALSPTRIYLPVCERVRDVREFLC